MGMPRLETVGSSRQRKADDAVVETCYPEHVSFSPAGQNQQDLFRGTQKGEPRWRRTFLTACCGVPPGRLAGKTCTASKTYPPFGLDTAVGHTVAACGGWVRPRGNASVRGTASEAGRDRSDPSQESASLKLAEDVKPR